MNTDLARLIVAIISALAALAFFVRINDDWKRMSLGWRVSRVSMLTLIIVFGYGAIELMLIEPPVPLGLRVYLAALSLSGIVVGMFMIRHEYGPNPGWIKASDIQDILDEVEAAHNDPCDNPGCLVARDRMRNKIKESRKLAAARL